jgi:hypothetical protein
VRSALALLALLACSPQREERHVAVARPAPVDAGPTVKPAVTTQGADISWLVGTWERQSAPKEWLLFNAPKEVGVIGGTPPALTSRGEFIPNGRFISLFFRGAGGATVERILEASADHTELRESSAPPATYRRGAPP